MRPSVGWMHNWIMWSLTSDVVSGTKMDPDTTLYARLRGMRLGARERYLLLRAPAPGVLSGPFEVTADLKTRAEKESMLRAARKLNRAGLTEPWYMQSDRRNGQRCGFTSDYVSAIKLTPLGAEVVKHYRRELTENKPIRWRAIQ